MTEPASAPTGDAAAGGVEITFVTVALANNRTESWISDRTGHRSSQMINKYKRTARSFQELEIGDLMPFDRALPELAGSATAATAGPPFPAEGGPGVGQRITNQYARVKTHWTPPATLPSSRVLTLTQ